MISPSPAKSALQPGGGPDGDRILVLSQSRDGLSQEDYGLGVYHWPSGEMGWLLDDPSRSAPRAHLSGPYTDAERRFPRLPAPALIRATIGLARSQLSGGAGYRLRNTFLSIFPTLVLGNSSTKT